MRQFNRRCPQPAGMIMFVQDIRGIGPGRIREDNRKIHPADLFEVKSPAASRGMWDF